MPLEYMTCLLIIQAVHYNQKIFNASFHNFHLIFYLNKHFTAFYLGEKLHYIKVIYKFWYYIAICDFVHAPIHLVS